MRLVLATFMIIGSCLVAVNAQSKDVLTVLQRSDTAQAGQEAVTAVDVLAPGARTSFHRHPGTMVAFVSEGVVTIEQESDRPVTYSAGQSFTIPPGVAHNSVNNGTSSARMFATFIVAKGQPLTTLVRLSRY